MTKPRKNDRRKLSERLLRELYYDQELSIREVALVVGCCDVTIARRMNDLKLAIRPRSKINSLIHKKRYPRGKRRPGYMDYNKLEQAYIAGDI